jgi:diadenosine tetraphosphatase ApaH/serine/threonine PP2A family protein phosphatase
MKRGPQFPWYDSLWLSAYVAADEYLERRHPECMAQFKSAMNILRTPEGFQVRHLKPVLPEELLQEIRLISRSLIPGELELHEAKSFGRWLIHDHPRLTEIQNDMTTLVSEIADEAVEPSYNFLSMYTQLGRCPLHMDAPQAKYTLDICIDQSHSWNIHISKVIPWPEAGFCEAEWDNRIKNDPTLAFASYALEPGEAILFSGSSQWHYRDPIPALGRNTFCDLLFFHYVPSGTRQLVDPTQWQALFQIPELAELPQIQRLSSRSVTRRQ